MQKGNRRKWTDGVELLFQVGSDPNTNSVCTVQYAKRCVKEPSSETQNSRENAIDIEIGS